jgi:hypothetical protein
VIPEKRQQDSKEKESQAGFVTLTDVDLGPRSSPEDHLFARKSLELLLLLEHSVGSCAREFPNS